MKNQHTPPPWKNIDVIGAIILDDGMHELKSADKEFILLAVNNHDLLLKAAKLGLESVESEEGSFDRDADLIRKIIAKVEQ